MPSHYAHSALVEMFHECDGAPWSFIRWCEITKCPGGLFPVDGVSSSHNWTQAQVKDVRSYFLRYSVKMAKGDLQERLKFSLTNGRELPGAELWRRFIINGWKTWKINDRITRVLIEKRLHPCILARHSKTPDVLPDSHLYIPRAVDAVGLELFGEEALDGLGHLSSELCHGTRAIMQRAWLSICTRAANATKNMGGFEEAALQAFADLEKEGSSAKVKAVINRVARWKAACEVLQSTEHNEKIKELESNLKELVDALGAKAKGKPLRSTTGLSKTTKKVLSELSTKDDIADVLLLYADFANQPNIDDAVSLENQIPSLRVKFGKSNDDSDPGVEVESSMPPATLAAHLGFPNGLPVLFNKYRHRGGLSPWDPDSAYLFDDEEARHNPEMTPFVPHWHQLAGAHAIIRKVFASESNKDACTGMLIADDVGLGKTCLATLVIAFLADAVLCQRKKRPGPPLLTSLPYLAHRKDVPDRPTLILIPGTLLTQWSTEFKLTVNPKAFDVMTYGTGLSAHRAFWATNGPFLQSNQPLSRRVIIASHPALIQDFNLLYAADDEAASKHSPLIKLKDFNQNVPFTLFRQKYLTVILDEAHEFRNTGPKHAAAFTILKLSALRLIMTATPLQTSTKDIAAMGRLVGVPFFLTQRAIDEEKQDTASIRRVRSSLPSDYDPLNDDEDDPIKICCATIASRMQGQFDGYLIRRSLESLDWKKNLLIQIPPYKTIVVKLKLKDEEMKILERIAEKVRNTVSNCNGILGIVSNQFYLEYRREVNYVRKNRKARFPTFATMEDWQKGKSTKLDTCAQLVNHLLLHDDAPEIQVHDGIVTYPPLSRQQRKEKKQTTKILIYQEFPSLGPLLRNVFDLYGIKYVYIDGSVSFEDRAKVIEKFCNDPEIRVLIFSSVGTVGLNLSIATIVIFLDQPWSGQDEKQARGRAHRQPQKKVVRCYHLLADNTADIILYSLARGKSDMMEAFLAKDAGREMHTLFTGHSLVEEGEDLTPTERQQRKSHAEAEAQLAVQSGGSKAAARWSGDKKAKATSTRRKSSTKAPKSMPMVLETDDDVDVEREPPTQKRSAKELEPAPVASSSRRVEHSRKFSTNAPKSAPLVVDSDVDAERKPLPPTQKRSTKERESAPVPSSSRLVEPTRKLSTMAPADPGSSIRRKSSGRKSSSKPHEPAPVIIDDVEEGSPDTTFQVPEAMDPAFESDDPSQPMSPRLKEKLMADIQAIMDRRLAAFSRRALPKEPAIDVQEDSVSDGGVLEGEGDVDMVPGGEELSDHSEMLIQDHAPTLQRPSEKRKGKQKAVDTDSESPQDVEMKYSDWTGIDTSGLVGNISTSSGFFTGDDPSVLDDQSMDDSYGQIDFQDMVDDNTGPSPWTTDGSASRPDSPQRVEEGPTSNAHAPRTPQVGQRRDRQVFSGGSGEKQPKRSRRLNSSDDDGDGETYQSRATAGASRRNISLSSRLRGSLSFGHSRSEEAAASSSKHPSAAPSNSSSERNRQAPVSSKKGDKSTKPPHVTKRTSSTAVDPPRNSPLPQPPKKNIFASLPHYQPPVQGPRVAPIDPRTVFYPPETGSATVAARRTVLSTSQPSNSRSIQLDPPFEYKPLKLKQQQHDKTLSAEPSPPNIPQPSASGSRHHFPPDLPPSDPPSPVSDPPSPDIPLPSPPVDPEDRVDWGDDSDDRPGSPNVPSARQSPHSPSRRTSLHSNHSSQSSNSRQSLRRDSRVPAGRSASPSYDQPSTVPAPQRPFEPASLASQPGPSRTAPGTQSAAHVDLSKHKSSRPSLRNPFPGRHAIRGRDEDFTDQLSPPPADHKSDNPYKTAVKRYSKKGNK